MSSQTRKEMKRRNKHFKEKKVICGFVVNTENCDSGVGHMNILWFDSAYVKFKKGKTWPKQNKQKTQDIKKKNEQNKANHTDNWNVLRHWEVGV